MRLDAWRQRAATHLHPRLAPLFIFAPVLGASVGVLNLSGPDGPGDSLEELRSTPAREVINDLERWP
ncbi:hypothetical protein [Streptomyces lasiicapitis]|uniref:hypothetical protein n=1 Tax=Streptomyces lasiicapitis TaxID=1923961 RepID=UPI0036A9719A